MSLAEDFDNWTASAPAVTPHHLRVVMADEASQSGPAFPVAPPPPRPFAVAQSEESFDLIERAATSMAGLIRRYEALEDELEQFDAWWSAKVQAAEDAADRWRASAMAAEAKLSESLRHIPFLTERAELAEHAMGRERATLKAVQDRIRVAFGPGCETEDVIEALA